MVFRHLDKDAVVTYIPRYQGNRGKEEPFTVDVNYVSSSRSQYYENQMLVKLEGVTDPNERGEVIAGVSRKKFVENISKISKFIVERAGNDKEITDPGDFFDIIDIELKNELFQAMISSQQLTEGQRKNS